MFHPYLSSQGSHLVATDMVNIPNLPMPKVNKNHAIGSYPVREGGYEYITFQIPPYHTYYSPESHAFYQVKVTTDTYPLHYSHAFRATISDSPIACNIAPASSIAIYSQSQPLTFRIGIKSNVDINILGGRIYPSVLPNEHVRMVTGEEAKRYGKELILSARIPRVTRHELDDIDIPSFYEMYKLCEIIDGTSTIYYPEMHNNSDNWTALDDVLCKYAPDYGFVKHIAGTLGIAPLLGIINLKNYSQKVARYESIRQKTISGEADQDIIQHFRNCDFSFSFPSVPQEKKKEEKEKENKEKKEEKKEIREKKRTCAKCGLTTTQKLCLCSQCRSVYYCNVECQKKAWQEHKQYCEENKKKSKKKKAMASVAQL